MNRLVLLVPVVFVASLGFACARCATVTPPAPVAAPAPKGVVATFVGGGEPDPQILYVCGTVSGAFTCMTARAFEAYIEENRAKTRDERL